jgi:hypothetical protein
VDSLVNFLIRFRQFVFQRLAGSFAIVETFQSGITEFLVIAGPDEIGEPYVSNNHRTTAKPSFTKTVRRKNRPTVKRPLVIRI